MYGYLLLLQAETTRADIRDAYGNGKNACEFADREIPTNTNLCQTKILFFILKTRNIIS